MGFLEWAVPVVWLGGTFILFYRGHRALRAYWWPVYAIVGLIGLALMGLGRMITAAGGTVQAHQSRPRPEHDGED